jgi:ATP-dependent DNA helicase DinG
MHGGTALPEHSAVIIDEAHELVARVTGAASSELSPAVVERAARRALTWLDDEVGLELLESADTLRSALDQAPLARVEDPEGPVALACQTVRAAARAAVSALTEAEAGQTEQRQAAAAVKEVHDIAERMSQLKPVDVVWVSERDRSGRDLRVAPLSVAALMRDRVFGERPTILTSATLTLGGTFDQAARSVGLRLEERVEQPPSGESCGDAGESSGDPDEAAGGGSLNEHQEPWLALDAGSPFDYRRQGILYVARRLPAPGRDGLPPETLREIAELVWAAGGRTLGLFSSRRAAETAATYVRRELPKLKVLCQGDAQLPELTRAFIGDESSSLFGTLSLWQGLDVPGATCQLVIIDRIPFPRPDDPLVTARQRAVAEAGGNGFMSVAATHAALLLAQGAGRLIRRLTDRGMVAVLDPRLATARYAGFLRASMPDFWPTSDQEVAVQALRRLAESPR